MELTSPAFIHNTSIPSDYTCDGQDRSPELVGTDPPENTQSFALIVDDPDAPNRDWVHWVLFNIPKNARKIIQGGTDGKNSWGKTGYGGPCPPNGTHRYFFKIYALDTVLNLKTPTKTQLENAMKGHILGKSELVGTYQKK